MKRILSFVFAVLMVASLSACKNSDKAGDTDTTVTTISNDEVAYNDEITEQATIEEITEEASERYTAPLPGSV